MRLILSIIMVMIAMVGFVFAGNTFMTYIHYDEVVSPDEPVEMHYKVKNTVTYEIYDEIADESVKRSKRLDDVHVRVYVPELGVYASSGSHDIRAGESYASTLLLDLDQAPPGEYLVRYTVSNDDYRRTKYRMITVR